MKDKIYEELKDKKVLILGFGREGKSTYNLIREKDKDIRLGIADLKEITDPDITNDNNIDLYIGDNYLDACKDYDVIIKGPGVIIKDYLPSDIRKKITCQTDLFVKYCPNKMIGITGTKGKSTTSSLMYHILSNMNVKSILMGNIGIPVFDTIDKLEKDTICVMELGCHQLEYMKHSPNISVILDIYEEHLDHYIDFNHYIDAKKNIYRYQTEDDYIILGDSPYLKDETNSITLRENKDFYLDDNNLIINKDIVIPISNIKTKLEGKHNLYNILICLVIANILELDINKCIETISSFDTLPHRLEYVGKYDDILFYDDSIATSCESVIFAVKALNNVDTIIIGGMERGIKYDELVSFLDSSNVNNILLLPDTNTRIKGLFDSINSKKNVVIVKDMEEAVSIAKDITEKEKICLLSPAAASYGFYKNFEERGDHFKQLVENK